MQRPTNDGASMGKRALEGGGGDDDQPERKRPALAR